MGKLQPWWLKKNFFALKGCYFIWKRLVNNSSLLLLFFSPIISYYYYYYYCYCYYLNFWLHWHECRLYKYFFTISPIFIPNSFYFINIFLYPCIFISVFLISIVPLFEFILYPNLLFKKFHLSQFNFSYSNTYNILLFSEEFLFKLDLLSINFINKKINNL